MQWELLLHASLHIFTFLCKTKEHTERRKKKGAIVVKDMVLLERAMKQKTRVCGKRIISAVPSWTEIASDTSNWWGLNIRMSRYCVLKVGKTSVQEPFSNACQLSMGHWARPIDEFLKDFHSIVLRKNLFCQDRKKSCCQHWKMDERGMRMLLQLSCLTTSKNEHTRS